MTDNALAHSYYGDPFEHSKSAPYTWRKVGKAPHQDGPRIVYQAQENSLWEIASWKHSIPHANGVGSWDHTTFLIYYSGVLVHREETTLINAKRWVEAHKGGGAQDGTQA